MQINTNKNNNDSSNTQACPWDIFFCPIPSHSKLCLPIPSHPMGFPSEYSSIKIIKFIKIYVYCLLNRTICSDGIQNFKNRFFFIFSPKIRVCFKKKSLHFDFISNFSIFFPKLRCSLKKKKKKRSKGLHSQLFFTL